MGSGAPPRTTTVERMTASSLHPLVLRGGVEIDDPLQVVLGCIEAGWVDVGDHTRASRFGEPELRVANRGGARISAAERAAVLERRSRIERALRAIAPDASLARVTGVPWLPLRQLFDAFSDIRGVGLAKTTKALHPVRPALIPMLDSVVQAYLEADDPGANAPFGERALDLVRGYKGDLDRNRPALRRVRKELAGRACPLTEVRILDLVIWSVATS